MASSKELYGTDLAEEYLRQLEDHEIYRHDETAVIGKPYCASVTLYPFLFQGNTAIGGTSEAPKNLASFSGAFINLVFALASQFCGAVSTPGMAFVYGLFHSQGVRRRLLSARG